jgi:hypothetical protein
MLTVILVLSIIFKCIGISDISNSPNGAVGVNILTLFINYRLRFKFSCACDTKMEKPWCLDFS